MLDFCGADKFSLMKVMITVTQTDHPHRMKVWVEPFQRLARVEGVKPSSPPQRRNIPYGLSLVLSLAYFSKERTEKTLSM